MDLRLVIPAWSNSPTPVEAINNIYWRLSDPIDLSDYDNIPRYHVVAFAWAEDDAQDNLFGRPGPMPSNTRAALETAMVAVGIDHDDPPAFWIDAVCIAAHGPARNSALRSLGFIYNQAVGCVVVLGTCAPTLVDRDLCPLEPENSHRLLKDPWLCRLWTHLEIFNCSAFLFTSFDLPVRPLPAQEMMAVLERHKPAAEYNVQGHLSREFTSFGHNLDILFSTLPKCLRGEWTGNSFLASLTGIVTTTRRDLVDEDDQLNSLLGNLVQFPSTTSEEVQALLSDPAPNIVLQEYALRICEALGDFSYIYLSNARDACRRWRPKPNSSGPNPFQPILSAPLLGAKQRGMLDGVGLKLHGMVHLPCPPNTNPVLSSAALAAIHAFLTHTMFRPDELPRAKNLPACMVRALNSLGFPGKAAIWPCVYGFIAVHSYLIPWGGDVTLLAYASAELRWGFGGHPGIAKVVDRRGDIVRYAPLVFVGEDLRTKTVERFIKLFN